jgi:hypothetical protein
MKKLLNSVVSMVTWMVVALLAGGASSVLAAGAGQQPSQGQKLANAAEHQNMQLVGSNDLQARSTYQPAVHHYADGRYILFAGHHALGTNPVTGQPLPSFNPLTGNNEPNGTSIVDVTDPKHPVYLFHIPVGTTGNGGAQYDQRICDGSTLPIHNSEVYLLRSYSNSAHEIWDVKDPAHPVGVRTVAGGNPVIGSLAGTHKSWWECDTGIAYIVGRRATDTAAGWGLGNHMFIMDLSNPASPVFLRDWALNGQQPGGVIPPNFNAIPSIHGPISTGPGPSAPTITGNSPNPISGTGATLDRVYFAYGTGSNGVMQVADRTKLLPPPWGTGVKCGSAASTLTVPSCATADFTTPEIGRWVMNPINGAHTSYPIGKIAIADWAQNEEGTVRDFVVVTSEETNNECTGPRHLTYMVDVTEFTITASGATVSHPQNQANFQVPESDGEFCDRGGRFGPHSTQEEFGPPFYQKVVFVAYFNAGVRAVDVRDPFNPQEVAFYIPATTANTDYRCKTADPATCKIAIQTNNLATDDRGYIYIADRADTGVHILQLTGPGLDPLK